MKLTGKVALITGASKGIGRAIALEFAKAGASVLINYHSSRRKAEEVQKQAESYGVKARIYQADVSDSGQVREMYAFLDQEFGTIDILVNNAGFAKGSAVEEMSDELWDRMIRVHLYGTFYNCREAVKRMKVKKSGKIINISSDLGQLGCEAFSHYSAAKGGINAFTKSLARELAPEILVNAVAPSGTWTDILIPFGENYAEIEAQKYPLKRLAQPEEIAKSVLFLASDYANFYTGQILGPNGGVVMNG
ncbi:3-oxoacyl-(acyl-carrier-protein) reductase [Geobacillus sp. GHH01]|uniref:SDR family NAD(P)-dependent oxidoreductase n=1 Tax=Geobacillus sp. GHH01 TaxID=1233873 RepID=UPI0002AF2E3A|nr:3-oxoacyl-ACP reductase family protein [Geobacillus sp. GHH01]AGE21866.1 3-oxoacyl-(acyl-carrier-protein) reductase [Geobacillus sp. GHH01]